MKVETEDLTQKLTEPEELFLVGNITEKYDKYDDMRAMQLSDIRLVREAIFNSDIPKVNGWDSKIELPDIYELAQTLKSHISENLYSHPDAMFDVTGNDYTSGNNSNSGNNYAAGNNNNTVNNYNKSRRNNNCTEIGRASCRERV